MRNLICAIVFGVLVFAWLFSIFAPRKIAPGYYVDKATGEKVYAYPLNDIEARIVRTLEVKVLRQTYKMRSVETRYNWELTP